MYNQVLICEGVHDVIKIQSVFPNLECIITNGSEISIETIEMIKEYSKKYEIILFFDPDYPGERIRNKILEVVPNAKNAYIEKELCISQNHKKVGVEHAKKEDIKRILTPLLNSNLKKPSILTINDLIELKIEGSKATREFVARYYNIGVPNNKTLLKRLMSLGVTKEELKEIIKNYQG